MKKVILFCTALIFITSCNVKKEEKGEMPEMDIEVTADAGELPEYEVNWADVNIGTTTKTVEVPKVVVVMEEEQVEVPVIDIDMPGDDTDKEERTIMVEAEVTEMEHDLDIRKIYASENNLYVVSELMATEQSIGDRKMRISDQVVLNAPDMNIKYYVVGHKPVHMFNSKYTYMDSMSDIESKMKDYKVIYTK